MRGDFEARNVDPLGAGYQATAHALRIAAPTCGTPAYLTGNDLAFASAAEVLPTVALLTIAEAGAAAQ